MNSTVCVLVVSGCRRGNVFDNASRPLVRGRGVHGGNVGDTYHSMGMPGIGIGMGQIERIGRGMLSRPGSRSPRRP